ncbi:MAG: FeoA family protein [Eubacteriales bacterium]|nr:FeoA family protein [Eubacteriales bacterium]
MNTSLNLNDINPGQCATVKSLLTTGELRRRLLDMGLTPETTLCCLGRSPLGDPSAFFVRGTVIALRRQDCRKILIEKKKSQSYTQEEPDPTMEPQPEQASQPYIQEEAPWD